MRFLYSSYSADGWCLKRTPVADLAVVRLGPDQIQSSEYPAANEWTGESAPQKPYVDWPSPLVWLPVPSVTRTSPDSPGIEIGLGAAVLGTSLLGRTQWAADAAWFFASQQPQAALSIAWVTGPFTVSAQSQLAYQYSDTYTESIESSLTLGLPVLHEIDFDTQKAITLFLGVDHRAQLESTAPFTFAQSAGPLAGDWQNALFVTSGVSLQWRRDGGRIDFDPPLALTTLLQNSTRLPVLDYPAPESAFLLGVTLNIPSFVPHNVFRLG